MSKNMSHTMPNDISHTMTNDISHNMLNSIEKNLSNKTSEKYICNICGKELKTQTALIYHQNKKNSCANSYPCKICNKNFTIKFHLKAHMLDCGKIIETSLLKSQIDIKLKTSELNEDTDDIDYKKVLEYTPDMIVKYDNHGKFEFVSNASIGLIGYSPEELIGKNGYEFILEEDIDYITESHKKIIKEKKENATFVFRRVCKDGSIKKIIAQANAIFDACGNITNAISCERAL